MKHQLLTYTTPTARPATALAMTVGPPQSADTSLGSLDIPVAFHLPTHPSQFRLCRRIAVWPEDSATDCGLRPQVGGWLLPLWIFFRGKANNQESRQGGGGSVRIVEGGTTHQEKAMVIRLNRQMREKNVQLSSLQYELDTARAVGHERSLSILVFRG